MLLCKKRVKSLKRVCLVMLFQCSDGLIKSLIFVHDTVVSQQGIK